MRKTQVCAYQMYISSPQRTVIFPFLLIIPPSSDLPPEIPEPQGESLTESSTSRLCLLMFSFWSERLQNKKPEQRKYFDFEHVSVQAWVITFTKQDVYSLYLETNTILKFDWTLRDNSGRFMDVTKCCTRVFVGSKTPLDVAPLCLTDKWVVQWTNRKLPPSVALTGGVHTCKWDSDLSLVFKEAMFAGRAWRKLCWPRKIRLNASLFRKDNLHRNPQTSLTHPRELSFPPSLDLRTLFFFSKSQSMALSLRI